MVTLAEKLAFRQAESGLKLLEQLGCAAALVDAQGFAVRLNAHADAMLGADLRLVGRRLSASDVRSNDRLQHLIASTLKIVAGHAPSEPVVVNRNGKPWLSVEVIPISGIGLDMLGAARAIVLLTDIARPAVPSDALLRTRLGLTPAEARVALRLGTGESLADAAEALGITRETGRALLKRVFAKADVHRQAELVALIARMSRRP
jgi:DNA-binding CsgD family transcriptional regulator